MKHGKSLESPVIGNDHAGFGRGALEKDRKAPRQRPTSPDARVHLWSLWIDRAHHHRLVEVIQIPDERYVRLRPVRDSQQQPASYLEAAAALGSTYEQVRP